MANIKDVLDNFDLKDTLNSDGLNLDGIETTSDDTADDNPVVYINEAQDNDKGYDLTEGGEGGDTFLFFITLNINLIGQGYEPDEIVATYS